jgi:hypothetical protein
MVATQSITATRKRQSNAPRLHKTGLASFRQPPCARLDFSHDCAPEVVFSIHHEGNPAREDVHFPPADVIEIKDVLFGADQRLRSQLSRFIFDGYGILLRVEVMVAKKGVSYNLEAPMPQVRKKSGRIANAAKGEKRLPPSFGKRYFPRSGCARCSNGFKIRLSVKNRRRRIMAHCRFDSRDMLAPRNDDYIRARQRRPRFPQTSRWKQMAAPKGVCSIDQHNIYIARKLPVLKAIVKNEPSYSSPSKLLA